MLLVVASCNSNYQEENTSPKLRDITETVYASVKIQPELSYFPQPLRPGIIKKILVKEGDSVLQGQELFQQVRKRSDILLTMWENLESDLRSINENNVA